MTVTITPPIKEITARFTKAQANTAKERKAAVVYLSKKWVQLAREEAPEKTGEFKRGIEAEFFLRSNAYGFEGSRPDPLGKWIIFGTKPHIIKAKKANALYFFWPKIGRFTIVPKDATGKGGYVNAAGKFVIRKGYVNHPGTKPNDYFGRAYSRWITEAEKQVKIISDKFISDFGAK